MRLKRSCKEVTTLVLQGYDRRLALGERIVLRLHWRVCGACAAFRRQADFMDQAMKRWRAYREADPPA